jgi:hypothetical protein
MLLRNVLSKILLFAFFSLLLLSLPSCNSKFNKQEWTYNPDLNFYPNRNSMYVDLIKNHQLLGLKYSQLVDSIGEPEKDMTASDSNSINIVYPIEVEYDIIDPDYSKDLIIKLNKDSIVLSAMVNEWKKRKGVRTLIHVP